MRLRLPTIAEVVTCLCVVAWGSWLGWSENYTHDVYLLDGRAQYWIALIAGILGACASFWVWKRDDNSRGKVDRLKMLVGTFIAATVTVFLTFMNVPKIVVALTLHQRVSETYPFRMAYPGPSCGKHCRCTAGVIYFDPYLRREIEFCQWEDASSFFYTDSIRVEKLLSDKGGKILSHEAVH